MADLTSKLADSIKKSMSGFGAGIKGSFMSANPAGFGLAMKGIASIMATQVTLQKKDFEQRQRDRQFAEETSNEQKKLFTDILSVLNDIKKALGAGTGGSKDASPEKSGGFSGFAKALAAIIATIVSLFKGLVKGITDYIQFWNDALTLLKGGFLKILDFFADLFKALKDGPIGKFFKAFADLFDDLLKIIKDGPIGKFFAAVGKYFDDILKLLKDGPIGKFFAAVGKYFDDVIRMFREGPIGKFFANIGKYFDDIWRGLREGSIGSSISNFFKNVGSYFDNLLNGLREGSVGKFFVTMGDMLKDKWGRFLLIFDEIGILFREKFPNLSEALSKFKDSIAKIFTFADDAAGGAGGGSIFDDIVKGFNKTMDFFKGIFGFFGRIGAVIGDVTGLTGLFEGTFKLIGEFMEKLKFLAKIPFLAQIISAIEGIFEAFDTDSIAKSLNKAKDEVKFFDRIAGFFGGFIGSFIGGVADLIANVSVWVFEFFGGKWREEKEGEESVQTRMTRYFTAFFGGIFQAIGTFFTMLKGVVTGDSGVVKKAVKDMGLLVDDFVTGLMNGISAIINAITGTVFDVLGKIPGMADKAAEWKAKTQMNSNRVSERQSELTAAKAAAATATTSTGSTQPGTMGAYKSRGGVAPAPASSTSGSLSPYVTQPNVGSSPGPAGDVLSVRNNNPGNLRYYSAYSQTPKGVTYGALPGAEGSFAVFPTKEAGLEAMRKQIVLDTQTRGMTLTEFIGKYAPKNENDTGLYANQMAASLGIGLNDRIPADKIPQLQSAMILKEGGPTASSYYGTPSSALSSIRAASPITSGGSSSIVGNSWGSSSNVNSPDAPPTGTEDKPVYTVTTETNPVDKVQQDKVEASIIKAPELSQEQLDEMKRQQLYREKIDAENKRYRDQRDSLEKQFRATLENNIRGQLTAAIPMGATGLAATTNAGANIANKYLSAPMEKLATQLFGKDTGKGVGTIFTQLAGSYGNQLISNVLAPAFGMEGGQMNRALNNFASGNKGAGWADLMYGMTGISTDLRTAFGYEEGINNFSRNLANITASPFSPLFNMGSTAGVSPAEISATNAGIITQNAATQNAQIMVAAGQAFGQSVVGAASDFGKSVSNGGQGGVSSTGGLLGKFMGALTGTGSAVGGGTVVYGPEGQVYTEASTSSNADLGFLGNLGRMMTGGRSRNPIATGTDFVANLGGSFIGNKLGIDRNSFGGVLAQTGINATLRSLLTTGGPGVMATLANLAPGALLGPGLANLGASIGGTFGTSLSGFAGGMMGGSGMSAGASAMEFLTNPTSMLGEGAASSTVLSAQLGSLASAAGSALGGVAISKALSGGYKLDGSLSTVSDIAVAISSVFGPVGMVLSGVIGAAVNRLFGMKAPELRGMGIEGTLGASTEAGGSGTKLGGWKNMFSKGGAYRSDRNERSTFEIPPDVANALMEDIDKNIENMQKATSLLGMTSDKNFADFTQAITLDFQNKSAQEQEQLLVETLKKFNAAMLESVFPFFKDFVIAGEDSIAAMNRLATSSSVFDASFKMLGYDPLFNATSVLDPNLNIAALRAAKFASTPGFENIYYSMKKAQIGTTEDPGYYDYESGNYYGGSSTPIYGDVRDKYIGNAAADLGLVADFKNSVLKSFGGGDLEKGRTAMQTASQSFFSRYYSAKEQRDIALKLAQEKITEIEKETGGTGLTGVDATTKYQERIDNYRRQVDDAKAAMEADPTNQTKIDRYTKLMNNADAYATSVQNVIGLSKAIASPQDAAIKNANLQASLNALASETQFLGKNGTVSLADVSGSTFTGAASLGGYNVTQNVAAVTGAGFADGTGIPNNNNNDSAVITPSTGGGTLFAPTTYVDGSSTNVVGSSGNDNVRDTYSHPILGSTERSVSSTYNYNYLYR